MCARIIVVVMKEEMNKWQTLKHKCKSIVKRRPRLEKIYTSPSPSTHPFTHTQTDDLHTNLFSTSPKQPCVYDCNIYASKTPSSRISIFSVWNPLIDEHTRLYLPIMNQNKHSLNQGDVVTETLGINGAWLGSGLNRLNAKRTGGVNTQ